MKKDVFFKKTSFFLLKNSIFIGKNDVIKMNRIYFYKLVLEKILMRYRILSKNKKRLEL